MFKPDFTEMTPQRKSAGNLPPGNYTARIINSEIIEKDDKPPSMKLALEIFNASNPAYNGVTVTDFLHLSGRGAFRLWNLLEDIDLPQLKSGGDENEMVGKEVEITVSINAKNPKYRNIDQYRRYIIPGTGDPKAAMDAAFGSELG